MNSNNKEYYLELVERWFDAGTSEAEEQELKRFLAGTDDPAFDEARAAFGFLAASSLLQDAASSLRGRGTRKPGLVESVPDSSFGPVRTAGLLGSSPAPASGTSKVPPRRFGWLLPAVGMAASLALAFLFGRMTAPAELVPVKGGTCISYVHGVEVADEAFAVASMESTLSDLFSASSDPAADLTLIFNASE